jgi:hypothetical protein
MYGVHDYLEQRKALGWQADTSPDYNTGIVCRGQVTFYRLPSSFIGADEAEISLPSPVCHLLQPERKARAYLLGTHPSRQRRIGIIYSVWVVADQQNSRHGHS